MVSSYLTKLYGIQCILHLVSYVIFSKDTVIFLDLKKKFHIAIGSKIKTFLQKTMCFESQTTSTTYTIRTSKLQSIRKGKGFGFFFQWVLVIPSTILFYFFRTPFALTIIVKWPLFFFISTTSLKAIRSAIKKVWENSLVSFSCLDKAKTFTEN